MSFEEDAIPRPLVPRDPKQLKKQRQFHSDVCANVPVFLVIGIGFEQKSVSSGHISTCPFCENPTLYSCERTWMCKSCGRGGDAYGWLRHLYEKAGYLKPKNPNL